MKKLIVLILPFFLLMMSCKEEYHVERSITIDAPKDVVWQQIKYFNNWKNWSPWYAADSTMEWTFDGVDGELESSYSWTGENSGSGTMTNTGITEGEELKYHVHFMEPWESETDGYLKLTETEDGTQVTWGFEGVLKGISSLFVNMDEMVGPDFEKGLGLLKEQAESQAIEAPSLSIQEIDYPGKTFVAIREEIDITGITSFYADNYGTIMASGVQMENGFPSGLYYTWDYENMQTDLAAAIPVADGTLAPEGMEIITIPASKALLIDYYGDYEGIGSGHEMLEAYMVQNEFEFKAPAIEEYVTDPMEEPDPNKWLTKIIYLVK